MPEWTTLPPADRRPRRLRPPKHQQGSPPRWPQHRLDAPLYRAPPTFMWDASTGSKKTSVTPHRPARTTCRCSTPWRWEAGLVSHATKRPARWTQRWTCTAGAVLEVRRAHSPRPGRDESGRSSCARPADRRWSPMGAPAWGRSRPQAAASWGLAPHVVSKWQAGDGEEGRP